MKDHSRRSDIVFAALLALVLALCWVVRHEILLIYASSVLAVVFAPAVRRVQQLRIGRHRPNTGGAVLILAFALIFALAGFGLLIVPKLSGDLRGLTHDLPSMIAHFQERILKLPFGARIAPELQGDQLAQHVTTLLKQAAGPAVQVVSSISSVLLLGIMTAYFLIDGERLFKSTIALLPADRRNRAEQTLAAGADRMQKWLGGQALLMLILGCSSFVVFWALQIRYFYALALFAGLANFIPFVGPIATVILAGTVAAIDSWTKVAGVLIFYAVYQQVESAYLTPHIMRTTVQLPAIAVLIALTIGSGLAGVLGAIIAVPTAALIATILAEYGRENG